RDSSIESPIYTGRDPIAFGAEDDDKLLVMLDDQLVQSDRTFPQSHARNDIFFVLQELDAAGPRVDPRPGDLEHRAHGYPNAAPIQRVGAVGRDEHRIDPQGRGGTEQDRKSTRLNSSH